MAVRTAIIGRQSVRSNGLAGVYFLIPDRIEQRRCFSSLLNHEVYRAQACDCQACEFRQQCCPKGFQNGRIVSLLTSEPPQMTAFREKMQMPEAKKACQRRGPVAELPNAWIKEKFGICKFRLRGLAKASIEALWACLTYHVMQWIRLVWRQGQQVAMQTVK